MEPGGSFLVKKRNKLLPAKNIHLSPGQVSQTIPGCCFSYHLFLELLIYNKLQVQKLKQVVRRQYLDSQKAILPVKNSIFADQPSEEISFFPPGPVHPSSAFTGVGFLARERLNPSTINVTT